LAHEGKAVFYVFYHVDNKREIEKASIGKRVSENKLATLVL